MTEGKNVAKTTMYICTFLYRKKPNDSNSKSEDYHWALSRG